MNSAASIAARGADTPATNEQPSPLLWCGLAAAALFCVSSVVQGLARSGFDLSEQPISFLMLGDLGFLERATFVITAALVAAFAHGLRSGTVPATWRWAPLLVAGLGIGLAVAGLFPPDPGFGYPAGTPAGPPAELTYRSSLHGVGFMMSFLCFALACAVYVRRAMAAGHWGFAAYTAASALVALALGMSSEESGLAVRNLISGGLLWGWVGVLSLRMLRQQRRLPG